MIDTLEINQEYLLLEDVPVTINREFQNIAFGTKVRIYKVDSHYIYFNVVGNKKIKVTSDVDDPTLFLKYTLKNAMKVNRAIRLQKQINKLQEQLNSITFN